MYFAPTLTNKEIFTISHFFTITNDDANFFSLTDAEFNFFRPTGARVRDVDRDGRFAKLRDDPGKGIGDVRKALVAVSVGPAFLASTKG